MKHLMMLEAIILPSHALNKIPGRSALSANTLGREIRHMLWQEQKQHTRSDCQARCQRYKMPQRNTHAGSQWRESQHAFACWFAAAKPQHKQVKWSTAIQRVCRHGSKSRGFAAAHFTAAKCKRPPSPPSGRWRLSQCAAAPLPASGYRR